MTIVSIVSIMSVMSVMSVHLTVKLLNGDLVAIEFDKPHNSLVDILCTIWKECGLQLNHFVFHTGTEDDKNPQIVLGNLHAAFDANKDDLFVDQKMFHMKTGMDRVVDISRFGSCHAAYLPKPRNLVFYCDEKNGTPKCLDLHDLTYVQKSCNVRIYNDNSLDYRQPDSVSNNQCTWIDVDSFIRNHPQDRFRSGPTVGDSGFDRVDRYIARYTRGYLDSFHNRIWRKHFNITPILEITNSLLPDIVTK